MPFHECAAQGLLCMTAPNISVPHAFTTRYGGVSSGVYESLNLGLSCGDDPVNVWQNYTRVCSYLEITDKDIVRAKQVHGSEVRVVSRCDCKGSGLHPAFEADGLLTSESNLALVVLVADCVPIMLHDPRRGVIGIVHAGWRGTAAGIVKNAISGMAVHFGCSPAGIKAAIGPCISKCCFETDSDVYDGLYSILGNETRHCASFKENKYHIDLKEANRLLLLGCGLTDIAVSYECTSCCKEKYWSHRRDNIRRGSQAAFIMQKP